MSFPPEPVGLRRLMVDLLGCITNCPVPQAPQILTVEDKACTTHAQTLPERLGTVFPAGHGDNCLREPL